MESFCSCSTACRTSCSVTMRVLQWSLGEDIAVSLLVGLVEVELEEFAHRLRRDLGLYVLLHSVLFLVGNCNRSHFN
jgi:hypothetical protein